MNKPISYKQYDSRWKNTSYSNSDEKTTIGRAGCGVVCSAMIIATLKNPNITPVETAEWSLDHGYKYTGGGTHYGYFVPQFDVYGIKCTRLNLVNNYGNKDKTVAEKALNELKKGHWLIACVGPGNWTSGGHYILVYGYEDGIVYINDPASSKTRRAENTFSLLADETKYFWSIEIEENNMYKIELENIFSELADAEQGINTLAKVGFQGNIIEIVEKKINPYKEPPKDYILYKRVFQSKEYVKWLQFELNESGASLKIDGGFGKLTDTALRKFQKDNGLYVDGRCGNNTVSKLKTVSKGV